MVRKPVDIYDAQVDDGGAESGIRIKGGICRAEAATIRAVESFYKDMDIALPSPIQDFGKPLFLEIMSLHFFTTIRTCGKIGEGGAVHRPDCIQDQICKEGGDK